MFHGVPFRFQSTWVHAREWFVCGTSLNVATRTSLTCPAPSPLLPPPHHSSPLERPLWRQWVAMGNNATRNLIIILGGAESNYRKFSLQWPMEPRLENQPPPSPTFPLPRLQKSELIRKYFSPRRWIHCHSMRRSTTLRACSNECVKVWRLNKCCVVGEHGCR